MRDIEKRLPAPRQIRKPVERTDDPAVTAADAIALRRDREPEAVGKVEAEPVRPGFSWKGVAGEFLEEHWQKLILCLAVLLIVVSSTVGAHLLLGPRLWSPVGKCSLALVYTLMFAAFEARAWCGRGGARGG